MDQDQSTHLRLLSLQREARRRFISCLDDYERIGEHGPDGGENDAKLTQIAISMLCGDIAMMGADVWINAGN